MKKILLVLAVALTLGACSKEEENNEPAKFKFPAGVCITEAKSGETFADGEEFLMLSGTESNFYISDSKGVKLGGESAKTKWSVTGYLTIESNDVGADVDVRYKILRFERPDNILCAEDEMGNKCMLYIVQKAGVVFYNDAEIMVSGAPQHIGKYTFSSGPYEAYLYIGRKSDGKTYNETVKWSSSDPSVIKLDEEVGSEIGIVAFKNGTSTITATDDADNELTFVITVINM